MIHEFHKAGYQRIRFSSGIAPSGMHWRCSITHASNMKCDGLRIDGANTGDEVAHYSTASGDCYFQWHDAPGQSARELGVTFLVLIRKCKRHIVTDTAGHLVTLAVHSAGTQDRDGAPGVLATIRRLYRWLRHIFADGGYASHKLRDALSSMGR